MTRFDEFAPHSDISAVQLTEMLRSGTLSRTCMARVITGGEPESMIVAIPNCKEIPRMLTADRTEIIGL